MATHLSKLLAACAFAFAAAGVCTPAAFASTSTTVDKHPKAQDVLKAKSKSKSRKAKKLAAGAAAAGAAGAAAAAFDPNSPEVAEPDITDTLVTEYACELGNKITIYTTGQDDSHIALRWKKRLHRLARVGTTTGALRFENPHYGLVWIGIPAKGILLDSKLNRQLANECKNAEQMASAGPAQKKS